MVSDTFISLILEARAYWRSRETCKTCDDACETAWNCARTACYHYEVLLLSYEKRLKEWRDAGGKGQQPGFRDEVPGLQSQDDYEKANKEKWVNWCKSQCGKDKILSDKERPNRDCEKILKESR